MQTNDLAKVGLHRILYKAFYAVYPTNEVEAQFVVSVLDPCAKPLKLIPSVLKSQVYVITDTKKIY